MIIKSCKSRMSHRNPSVSWVEPRITSDTSDNSWYLGFWLEIKLKFTCDLCNVKHIRISNLPIRLFSTSSGSYNPSPSISITLTQSQRTPRSTNIITTLLKAVFIQFALHYEPCSSCQSLVHRCSYITRCRG